MKQLFDSLFYKVKVSNEDPVLQSGESQKWDPACYLFAQQKSLHGQNYKFVDHPADSFIDYNSMVDNLEEEHLRRDVFTTATEGTANNAARVVDQDIEPAAVKIEQTPKRVRLIKQESSEQSKKMVKKPKSKLLEKQDKSADKSLKHQEPVPQSLIKKRGPRKKKEVVKQSDVPAAQLSRLTKQNSQGSNYNEQARLFGSKISFSSIERAGLARKIKQNQEESKKNRR